MENNGYARSLTFIVTKYLNEIIAIGYPKTYEGRNAFICPNPSSSFPALTDTQFALLTDEAYLIRFEAFQAYIESIETGLVFNDLPTGLPTIYDVITCPIV